MHNSSDTFSDLLSGASSAGSQSALGSSAPAVDMFSSALGQSEPGVFPQPQGNANGMEQSQMAGNSAQAAAPVQASLPQQYPQTPQPLPQAPPPTQPHQHQPMPQQPPPPQQIPSAPPAAPAYNVVDRSQYEQMTRAAVERTMEKYRTDLLRVLENMNGRLVGLEKSCEQLALSVGELHTETTTQRENTDERLKALDLVSKEVARKVNILKDKMEVAETQKELEKASLQTDTTTESQPPALPAPTAAPVAAPEPSPQLSLPPPPQQGYAAPPAPAPTSAPSYSPSPTPSYAPQPPYPAPPQQHPEPVYQQPQQQPPMQPPPPQMQQYGAPSSQPSFQPPPPQQQYAPPQYGGGPPPQPPPDMHYGGPTQGAVPYTPSSGSYGRPPPPPPPSSQPSYSYGKYEQVVQEVSNMGFNREQVRSVCNRLEQSGQTVDTNTVLDQMTR